MGKVKEALMTLSLSEVKFYALGDGEFVGVLSMSVNGSHFSNMVLHLRNGEAVTLQPVELPTADDQGEDK